MICLCLTHTGKQCSRKSLTGRRFCKQHDQEFNALESINKLPKLLEKVEDKKPKKKKSAKKEPKSAFKTPGSPSRGNISFKKTEDVIVFKRGVNKPGLVIVDKVRSPTKKV